MCTFRLLLPFALVLHCVEHSQPSTYVWEHKICGLGEKLCGRECYNPLSQKCSANRKIHQICTKNDLECGRGCYTPATQVCLNATTGWDVVVCIKGQSICGLECFNPIEPKRCFINAHGSYLCGKDEEACSRHGCYSAKSHACFEEEGELCELGKKPPCGVEVKVEVHACGAQEIKCGETCFDKKSGKVCLDNKVICDSGESLCGGKECYNPVAGDQCISGSYEYGYEPDFVCPAAKRVCVEKTSTKPQKESNKCYDPATHICRTHPYVIVPWEKDTENRTEVAELCPENEKYCGPKCFDPLTENCTETYDFPDEGGPLHIFYICLLQEEVCGSTCFNPVEDKKICLDGLLCPVGSEKCGKYYDPRDRDLNQCFNPKTQVCLSLKNSEDY